MKSMVALTASSTMLDGVSRETKFYLLCHNKQQTINVNLKFCSLKTQLSLLLMCLGINNIQGCKINEERWHLIRLQAIHIRMIAWGNEKKELK